MEWEKFRGDEKNADGIDRGKISQRNKHTKFNFSHVTYF